MPVSNAVSTDCLAFRSQSPSEHELVMTANGQTIVYRLTFLQLRLLAGQSVNALSMHPVRELPD